MPTVKEKIAHTDKQTSIPGVKNHPCQNEGRTWLLAKEAFCEARNKLMDAAEACIASMKKNKCKKFTCEGEIIEMAIKDASETLKAKHIDITSKKED